MKKFLKTFLPILLCFTLLLAVCGCDRIVGPQHGPKPPDNTKPTVPQSSDPRFSKQEGQGMSEYDIYSFISTYALPICTAIDYYAGDGMPYNEADITLYDGCHWAPVNNPYYPTLAELEHYVATFFAGGFLDDLRKSAGLAGKNATPRYADIGGKLHIMTDNLPAPARFILKYDAIKTVSNTEKEIKVTVDGIYNDKNVNIRLILTSTNEGWRITYWAADPIDAASSSAESK